MTLQQLYYFRELAQTLHYTKTATKLGIRQPSLSYAIAELEKELGIKLFEKTARKVSLTEKGKLFYRYICQGLESIDAGVASLQNRLTGSISTTLTIGYLHSVSANLLPDFIRRFRQANTNPAVHLNFAQELSGNLEQGLFDGTIDIIFSVQQPEGAISYPVYQQPICLYVPIHHPLAQRDSIRLTEVADEALILVNTQSGLRLQLEDAIRTLHKTPRIAFEVNSCDVVTKYVSLGHGIAILPQSDATPGYPVREIPLIEPALSRTIYLSHLPTLHLPEDMQQALSQVISEMTTPDLN